MYIKSVKRNKQLKNKNQEEKTMQHQYENIEPNTQIAINLYLEKLIRLKDRLTESEREYEFMRFLNTLVLTDTERFNIYTNTTSEAY